MRVDYIVIFLGTVFALSVGEKAESHDQWERTVRQTAETAWYDDNLYQDDAAHIVHLQEYYRRIFEEGWDEPVSAQEISERDQLVQLLHAVQAAAAQGKVLTDAEKTRVTEEALRLVYPSVGVAKNLYKKIRGRYIVMLQSTADDYTLDRTIEILQEAHRTSEHRVRVQDMTPFRHIGKGFTATMNSKAVELVKAHPLLKLIEQDTAVRLHEPQHDSNNDTVSAQSMKISSDNHGNSSGHVIWNLDRLDQHNGNLDGQYIPEGQGKNVDVYILDTGIRYTHDEFEGRAKYAGYDAIDDQTGSNQQGNDCRGHGSHCAGTVGGKTYGVAKGVNLYSARGLDCTGSGAIGGIIKLIDFIIDRQRVNGSGRPAVISESIGIKVSPALDAAVKRATDAGIVVVSSAGNQFDDSCKHSPAHARVGISVGSSDQNDSVPPFSNTGTCTDIFAPGTQVLSASDKCDTCAAVRTGTSMSCPHAAGYAAILLSLHPHLSPAEVKQRMIQQSTKGILNMSRIPQHLAVKTANCLLYIPEPTAKDNDFGTLRHDVHTQGAERKSAQKPGSLLDRFISLFRLNR